MTKKVFHRSLLQVVLIALLILFAISAVSARELKRVGSMQRVSTTTQKSTAKTEKEIHYEAKNSIENLDACIDARYRWRLAFLYKGVAYFLRADSWGWDNTIVADYIANICRAVLSLFFAVIVWIIELKMANAEDGERNHGKKDDNSFRVLYSAAAMKVTKILLIGLVVGAVLGKIGLCFVLATGIACFLLALSYVSNGGKIKVPKRRSRNERFTWLPVSIINAFGINTKVADRNQRTRRSKRGGSYWDNARR